MLPPARFGDLTGHVTAFPAWEQRIDKIPHVPLAVQAKSNFVKTEQVGTPIPHEEIGNQGSEPGTAGEVIDSVPSVSLVADEVDPENVSVPARSEPEVLQWDNVPQEGTVPVVPIAGSLSVEANHAPVDIAPVVADRVPDFHPDPGSGSAAAQRPKEPAPASTLPTSVPSASPPQLAIADWSYSLPKQAPVTFVNSDARSANAHRVVSAPIKSAPDAGRQQSNSKSTLADGARASRFAGQVGKVSAYAGTGGISGAGFAAEKLGGDKYRLVGSSIEFQMPLAANGVPAGNLTLHISADQEISLQLKELVSLLHDLFDPQGLQQLNAAQAINEFVSFDQLRNSGIDIRYDAARDRLSLSVDQP